jgi:hypothetical protein
MRWLLLIYTVPREPSRKRAFIWRELKKVGGVYLRDGVAVLPERPETVAALRTIAMKIEAFEGEATLVESAQLDPRRAELVIGQSHVARSAEYAEIARDAERFLAHVAHEAEHRQFTYAELEELEADLGKLRRWLEQVQARDYFATPNTSEVSALLERCDAALSAFLEETYRQVEAAP